MSRYEVRATYAVDLPDGRIAAPGITVDVDPKDAHVAGLVDAGHLVAAPNELSGDALRRRAAELDIEGRSSMTAAQLRDAVADATN